jgi:hypothetical protein
MTERVQEEQDAEAGGVPTPEEIAAAFVAHLGRTPVRDLLIQAMATMADAAGVRLGLGPQGPAVRDLDQARTAIESLRAMLAVAEQELGAAAIHPFREPLAQLQMAYARVAESLQAEGATGGDAEPGAPPSAAPAAGADPASRLWVPPGTRQ